MCSHSYCTYMCSHSYCRYRISANVSIRRDLLGHIEYVDTLVTGAEVKQVRYGPLKLLPKLDKLRRTQIRPLR